MVTSNLYYLFNLVQIQIAKNRLVHMHPTQNILEHILEKNHINVLIKNALNLLLR